MTKKEGNVTFAGTFLVLVAMILYGGVALFSTDVSFNFVLVYQAIIGMAVLEVLLYIFDRMMRWD